MGKITYKKILINSPIIKYLPLDIQLNLIKEIKNATYVVGHDGIPNRHELINSFFWNSACTNVHWESLYQNYKQVYINYNIMCKNNQF